MSLPAKNNNQQQVNIHTKKPPNNNPYSIHINPTWLCNTWDEITMKMKFSMKWGMSVNHVRTRALISKEKGKNWDKNCKLSCHIIFTQLCILSHWNVHVVHFCTHPYTRNIHKSHTVRHFFRNKNRSTSNNLISWYSCSLFRNKHCFLFPDIFFSPLSETQFSSRRRKVSKITYFSISTCEKLWLLRWCLAQQQARIII